LLIPRRFPAARGPLKKLTSFIVKDSAGQKLVHVGATCGVRPELNTQVALKGLIEIFVGMASLVCLVSGPSRS
jgi:hypothetical protein